MEDLTNILEAAFERAEPVFHDAPGLPEIAILTRDGRQEVVSLEEFRDSPDRVREQVRVVTPQSLAAYMNLYAGADHMAFVDRGEAQVRVLVDYHHALDVAGIVLPEWGDHAVTFAPAFAPAYAAWRALHRAPTSQVEAMEFLEDRMLDIRTPEPADIYEMVRSFESVTKVSFSKSQRLTDGRVQLHYSEEETGSGTVAFYERFQLMLPVFEGTEPQPIEVRVRHRTKDGKLFFVFVIANLEDLERAAFDRCCDVWRTALSMRHDLREVMV